MVKCKDKAFLCNERQKPVLILLNFVLKASELKIKGMFILKE
jgi:hypothetical protein